MRPRTKHRNGHTGETIDAQSAAPLYELRGVSKVYGSGGGRVAALEDVDLRIQSGELLAVVGASGSGKTTLLQLLGALDRPSSGTIAFGGRPLGGMSERQLTLLRRTRIGFVFQQFNLVPTLTARQNVEAKLAVAKGGLRPSLADELLDTVGLRGRAHHLPSQLSGGEQQRVAIAEHGQTVVLITHDRELAESSPRVIELRDGRILADHPGHARTGLADVSA